MSKSVMVFRKFPSGYTWDDGLVSADVTTMPPGREPSAAQSENGLRLTFDEPGLDNLFKVSQVISATEDFVSAVNLTESLKDALDILDSMSLQARSFSTGRILQESLARYPTLRVAMALRFAQIQVPMASEIAFIDELGLRNKEDISAELENLRRVVSPKVRRLSFNSPLVIELIGSAASGGLYLLKNPDRIGSWLPRIRKSWYTGQAEAERAHRIYTILKRAGIRAEELEDRKAIN